MKNINKIMFACMMMTVGSLSAGWGGKSMPGMSSATHSQTINFVVDKKIPGYFAGMTGNYNPKSDPKKAFINDADGNVVVTYSPATDIDSFNGKAPEGYTLIGTFSKPAPASKKCKTSTCAVAKQGQTSMSLYGILATNN